MSPFYLFAHWVCRLVFTVVWRLRIIGCANIPKSGSLIVAANHVSYLDPPLLGGAVTRSLFYMAKRQLFDIPFLGTLIRALNAFPVDRERGDAGAIRRTVEILKAGNAVVVFPEGTRNRDGQVQARRGVALLAALSGAPVLPVYISGTQDARNLRPIRVVFGEPFILGVGEGRKASREDLEKWTDEIMQRIYALGEGLK